ncbi:MAG: hypothetical protein R2852_02140 [Bacteroidia bacterium]
MIVSYNNYITDIGAGYFSYARTFKNIGTFSAGVLYVDYGDFDGRDESVSSYWQLHVSRSVLYVSYGTQVKEKISELAPRLNTSILFTKLM